MFWRHSNCPIAIKIHTADAILRTKLLYGLESAQLIPSVLKRVETFQLKVLRKILRMNTTYIDRSNTNQHVFGTANRKMKEEGKSKTIVTFVEAYRKLKRKRAARIIKDPESSIYKVSFASNTLRKWVHPNRRVGRPRMNWTEETVKEIWDHLKKDHDTHRYTAFDGNNEDIINLIKAYTES